MLKVGGILAVALATTAGAFDADVAAPWRPALRPYVPQVEVWTSDDVYRRGERARVWFRATEDAYVTILRVDTDGRLRVLYPRQPWHDNFVPGGLSIEIWNADYEGEYAFIVDDDPGQGYIFAVASSAPFEYGMFVNGDHWDYRNIAYYGRITGDPYVALGDLIDHIVPAAAYADYTYDVYPYYVERRYEYPRFLCYDCHSYVSYRYWDPYHHSCVRFRVVIYDDPFYYPVRAYPATRVVYTGPRRPIQRYVFRDWTPDAEYVTTVRQRPENPSSGRRTVSPGATARDVGGVGRVPAPVERAVPTPQSRARRAVTPNQAVPGAERALPVPRLQLPNATGDDTRPKLERRSSPQDTVKRPAAQVGSTPTARRSPAVRVTTPTRVTPDVRRPSTPTRPVTKPEAKRPTTPPKVKKPAPPQRKPDAQAPARRPGRPRT